MKDTSFRHIRLHAPILILIRLLTISLLIILPVVSWGQNNNNDDAKKILYLSCLLDDVSLNGYSPEELINRYVYYADSSYRNFNYKSSKLLSLHFSNNELIKHDEYSVQLYKIPRKHYPYYVLYFNSTTSTSNSFWNILWIRVSGYTENDIKIFFDGLLETGMNLDDIKDMVGVWRKNDELFDELDWDCLIDGYELNNTQRDCYISHSYSSHNAACFNCRHAVMNHNIYSSFSRITLLGYPEPRL